MAKSAYSRAKTVSILNNWRTICKQYGEEHKANKLSFGMVFKQDPYDCGRPKCCLCSHKNIIDHKKPRVQLRKEEREAKELISEE